MARPSQSQPGSAHWMSTSNVRSRIIGVPHLDPQREHYARVQRTSAAPDLGAAGLSWADTTTDALDRHR